MELFVFVLTLVIIPFLPFVCANAVIVDISVNWFPNDSILFVLFAVVSS